MDVSDGVELGVVLFFGIGGGIYAGSYMALRMAGEFVEESLGAARTLAFELLSNKTVQDIIRVGDKIPKLGGAGGLASGIGGTIAKWLGIRIPNGE